jgi:hypothetical protein
VIHLVDVFSSFLTGIVALLVVSMLVYWDAKSQGDKGAGDWAAGTFLLAIIVLPIYVFFRLTGRVGGECPNCHKATSKQSVTCKRCGAVLSEPEAKVKAATLGPPSPTVIISKPSGTIKKDKTSLQRIQRKTSSLVILAVVCVAPLVGLACYMVTPIRVAYTTTLYSPAVSVSTSVFTYEYYSTTSVGHRLSTYTTLGVGSACYGYIGSSCASYLYNTRRVYSTSIIPIYETTTMETPYTTSHTMTSTNMLTSTGSTYAVPTNGTTAAIVAVASIIIGALLVYAIAFHRPRPSQPPPAKAIEPESSKLTSQGLSTKFCRACGAKIPRDSIFCEECGTRLV